MYVLAVVFVRKSVLSEQYRWKRDVRSGKWKNVKCVLDVFTDVRNLQSAMALEKRTDMGSIKIRIQEFRRKYGRYRSNYRSVIRPFLLLEEGALSEPYTLMRQSMATSWFLFLFVNIQETITGLLLLLRRHLSNAGEINIKNIFQGTNGHMDTCLEKMLAE